MAVAMFHDNRIVLGHVGDSRIYRVRGGKLTPSRATTRSCATRSSSA